MIFTAATTIREFAVAAAICLLVVLVGAGCRRSSSSCAVSMEPSGPTYSISGVISAYHGGPLSATVTLYPSYALCEGTPSTQTDQQGHYSWTSLGSGTVGIWVGKQGYEPAYKNNLSAQESTANFILHPLVNLKASGDTFADIIRGDELITGDDVLFGGLCAHTACKIVEFDPHGGLGLPSVKHVEVRLRWNDPARRLALYISHPGDLEGPPFTNGAKAERYCCSGELLGTADLTPYFPDVVAVAFEQTATGPPDPSDSQAFELNIQPIP